MRSRNSTPEARRSGHASAWAMGVRMSGEPSCASTEPSTYSTSECTMLCAVDDDFDLRGRQAEQQAGLDELEALVHERGGIHRDLAAHDPVRMRAGLLRRDAARAARVGQSRNGPPEAVSRMRRTPGGRLAGSARRAAGTGRSRCARCRSGSSVAPDARTARISSGPAMTSDSLLASSRRLPARAAASVERRPAAPTMAAMTLSTSGSAAISLERARPGEHARGRRRARAARCSSSRGRRRRRRAPRSRGRHCTHLLRRASRRCGARRARPRGSDPDGARARRACSRRSSRWSRGRRRRSCADSQNDLRPSSANTSTGAAAVTLSMRSSTPPWPGNSVPLSFTPAKRLSRLSVRSPTIENATTARHSAHERPRVDGRTTQLPANRRPARSAPCRRTRLPRSCRANARRERHAAEPAAGEERADVRRPHEHQREQHPVRAAASVERAGAPAPASAGTSASMPASAADQRLHARAARSTIHSRARPSTRPRPRSARRRTNSRRRRVKCQARRSAARRRRT